ncbi:hypothetical protein BUALT_Bualt07G0016700 [Buddleja alternifolia]|uniref:Cytochrome P450 n=1 Tax=Buddleja alternifolia TaxID=168488 RepID=A0AAV6X7D2_9LAMI|nr:hypothetical protein BUALT_Bualt07G0016700 [Buddleja alternifolia]
MFSNSAKKSKTHLFWDQFYLKQILKFAQIMMIFHQNQIQEFLSKPFLLSLITCLSIYFLTKKLYKNRSNKQLPPSPPRLPILGNLHQLSPLTHRSLQILARKHGPIMLLHFGNRPVIIIQSSHAAMEIMKTNDLIFADKPGSNTTRRLFYDMKNISVAPYGEYWRKLKSICVLQLLSSKRVQFFHAIREAETALLMKKIKACVSIKPVNLSGMFRSLTNDVICRAAFGRKYSEGEDGKNFLMIIKEVMELLGSLSIGEFIPWLSWINRVNGFDDRVDKVARILDDFLEKVIQEHENDSVRDGSGENFVDILINIYKDGLDGVSIHRDSIKAIILKFEWGLPEGMKREDLDNIEQPGVTIHRKNPLFAVANQSSDGTNNN